MDYKYGFIGAGNMGGAIATAAAKVAGGDNILIADSNADYTAERAKVLGVKASDAETIAKECKLIFIGVKPFLVADVLKEIYPLLKSRKDDYAIVSMAAGVSISDINEVSDVPTVRIMPNTPVAVGAGMTVYAKNSKVTAETEQCFNALMSQSGRLMAIDESKIDAACSLSGCGPAFVYMFIEALADAGVQCGLSRKDAMLLAEQTVKGASTLALDSGKHPGELKDAVCSPGGLTIKGVHALENGGFRGAVMDAVVASFPKK